MSTYFTYFHLRYVRHITKKDKHTHIYTIHHNLL